VYNSDNDVDMIMNGLKTLPPRQFHDTINGVIVGLLKWQKNISKDQGNRPRKLGTHMEIIGKQC